MPQHYNYIIIGSGIIGMTLARELRHRRADATILIMDKEYHA
ncbi:MAG: NAD(P)-binding protein, partial [Candidatus Omnitrophica bacterium]|nr:NAD(P)-binding protein [Candidatus Omnitrophota bacterium]